MDTSILDSITKIFSQYVDWLIVVLVICAGYYQNSYLKGVTLAKDAKYDSTLKTLILGTLFNVVYLVILGVNSGLPKEVWAKLFFSYIFATSFYDILMRPIGKWIVNRFRKMFGANGKNEQDAQNSDNT